MIEHATIVQLACKGVEIMLTVNYEHTLEVEVINEFAANVRNKLINYLGQTTIDLNDAKHPMVELLNALSEMKNRNLFEKSKEELAEVLFYWQQMNRYIETITQNLGDTV
ncbi:hypothetical protein [Vagococcus acidifermentans]|uniref:Antitoxin epsilon/PezA domain-containing protein n=1 Tax=Vagococcus acidifermentans TaxID=564710 RepID=A0A430APP3_9ENTE|nr:hypothetical protein [Vagococcus acidifermentans]RSU09953.1 hypothetical protein CBF27_11695 [Vagococcus acidifermentans]